MPFDLTAFEDVLRTVFSTLDGLPEEKLVFSDQDARAPTPPFITVRIRGPYTMGGPKGYTWAPNGGPAGQELTFTTEGPARWVISLEALTKPASGTGSAQSLLEAIQTGLQGPTARATLNAAKVSIFDFGNVLVVPRVFGGDREGRATLDLQAYANVKTTETGTYVQKVGLSDEIKTPDEYFEVDDVP